MNAEQANRAALKAISESAWQKTVVGHALRAGWLTYYIPDAMWRRAFVSGIPQDLGNRGFPDLICVRGSCVLFRELKKIGGRLSEHQILWRDALLEAGADWALWTPADLDEVIATLWQGAMA